MSKGVQGATRSFVPLLRLDGAGAVTEPAASALLSYGALNNGCRKQYRPEYCRRRKGRLFETSGGQDSGGPAATRACARQADTGPLLLVSDNVLPQSAAAERPP